MRLDLQDVYRTHPRALIAAVMLIVAASAVVVVTGFSRGEHPAVHRPAPAAGAARAATTSASATTSSTSTATSASAVTTPSPGYHPSYANGVPNSKLNQAVAGQMAASGSMAAAIEAVTPARPAWTHDYPAVPSAATHDDQAYVTAFLQELLDRNYGRQSRSDLGRWVSAESADEMLPGSAAKVGDRVAWVELMDPAVVGERPGPVSSSAQWRAHAHAGVNQRVYDIFVRPDPQWQKALGAGLSTRDPLLTIDDVTGVITSTRGARTSSKHFSLALMVGSALHHPGYGVAAIDEWEQN